MRQGDVIIALWAILPDTTWIRLAARGQGKRKEPEWDIIEEDDDTVTVEPSIEQPEMVNVPYWHGWLKKGVWSWDV